MAPAPNSRRQRSAQRRILPGRSMASSPSLASRWSPQLTFMVVRPVLLSAKVNLAGLVSEVKFQFIQ